MSAGRKSTGINRKAIAKAIVEAMKDDRDTWDFGFPDREEIWANTYSTSFIYWARRPFWSIDECVALALGKDPSHISGLGMDIEGVIQTACGSKVEHIFWDIEDAQAEGELPKERIRPVEFLAWAKAKEVRLPNYFEEMVLDNEGEVAKLQHRNGELRQEIRDLRYKADKLRAADPAHKPAPKKALFVNRLPNLTHDRRPILTLLSDELGW
jgi:hypothetical protein